jgi:hypothetical protein
MLIKEFIQLLDKQINNVKEDILDLLTQTYSKDQEDRDHEGNQDQAEIRNIPISEAIQALQCLKLYELQHDQGQKSNILASALAVLLSEKSSPSLNLYFQEPFT